MTKKADGSVKVACQHGVKECYGNMLHACATDILDNVSQYLEYNSCMIRLNSNDTAAQKVTFTFSFFIAEKLRRSLRRSGLTQRQGIEL